MTTNYIIGIDPGPMTGIVGLWVNMNGHEPAPDILQCSAHVLVPRVLCGLTRGLPDRALYEWFDPSTVVIAMERFVNGPRASKLNSPISARVTVSTITVVLEWAQRRGIGTVLHSAADVKPWGTDQRLNAAGLLETTKGMRHARDAARHALFAAVESGQMSDPLSRRAPGTPIGNRQVCS